MKDGNLIPFLAHVRPHIVFSSLMKDGNYHIQQQLSDENRVFSSLMKDGNNNKKSNNKKFNNSF